MRHFRCAPFEKFSVIESPLSDSANKIEDRHHFEFDGNVFQIFLGKMKLDDISVNVSQSEILIDR